MQRDLGAGELDVNHQSTRMDTNFVLPFPEKADAELVAGIGDAGVTVHRSLITDYL
jgi:D-arabinose 1-dehydrogenase-like Zn-dependent alcohol dehydrogenase